MLFSSCSGKLYSRRWMRLRGCWYSGICPGIHRVQGRSPTNKAWASTHEVTPVPLGLALRCYQVDL